MKKKKNALLMILATVVALLAMSVNVWAAQKNPLAQMSTKTSAVLYSAPAGMGCDYFTPEYTSKVKISVKSYNTKVVTVKGYTFERNGKYSAGQVMARIYQAMGYKATVRSAIHDKKSRYPSNMIMGSDHYNVEVIMNGRNYYLDATPGCGGVYLSFPNEVLESYIYSGNGWERIQ